jgi:hypothetical protein
LSVITLAAWAVLVRAVRCTGILPAQQTKVSNLKVSHSTQDHQHARSPLGGLSDDDAHAELVSDIPDLKHKSHKNEVGFYSNLQCKLY